MTQEKKLAIPTIHMNGSNADSLMEDLDKAAEHLFVAYEAIKRTAPNGRDYYVQGDNNAIEVATQEHLSRLRRVDAVRDELHQIMEGIYDQKLDQQRRSG